MKTMKREAEAGEKIIITDTVKAFNLYDDELKGKIMTVKRAVLPGVYTEELGNGMYVNHKGYEVLEEN